MTNPANARSAREVFATVLRAIAPYAGDIGVIGGWVHALYLARAWARGEPRGIAVLTDDIDVTIPRFLSPEGRPQLIDKLLR